MKKEWLLVAIIVASTVMADLLQALEMRRHGEIRDFHPRGVAKVLGVLARKKYMILSIVFLAIPFFAFLALMQTADLSFAVPASAATVVFDTILARLVLKEKVDRRRWAGALLVAAGVWILDAF